MTFLVRLRKTSAAVLLVLGLATPFSAVTAAEPAASTQTSAVRIANFGRINATYYRGAQPEGRDYTDLAALGVKTVINLTSDDGEPQEETLTAQAGMRYVHLPMTTREGPTVAQLTQFLRLATDPDSYPVYVHCVGGRHRTGVMTAVYRMTLDGWTADQAFEEMKRYDFGPSFLHSALKRFVFAYVPAALAPQDTVTADATQQ